MRLGLACCVLCLAACSSQDRLAQRRDRIRELNQASDRVELSTYRSKDAVREARWGMTEAELLAVRGQPVERHGDALLFNEVIDGSTVASVYVFSRGQLAELRTRWVREQTSFARLEAALRTARGAPLPPSRAPGDLTEQQALDLAILFGGPLLTAPLVHAAVDAARKQPLHEAHWLTPETTIDLVSPDGELTTAIWRSRVFARQPVQKEATSAQPRESAPADKSLADLGRKL